MRWNHPGRGRIPPAEFIPLAEDTGLIVPLGRYVLEEACTQVAERHPGLRVQVNLSAIELEHPDLIRTITDVLQRTGIAPERLVLEVTETLLVQDAERGAHTLQQLRDLGVQLALDDFGTGYSSLSYLRNLPLDTLKIAREFVDGLAFSDHDAAFVRLIVGLAKTVGLKVVAEGIETRAQLDMLREIGCDLGQGFYFAAPMDVDADWLAPTAARLRNGPDTDHAHADAVALRLTPRSARGPTMHLILGSSALVARDVRKTVASISRRLVGLHLSPAAMDRPVGCRTGTEGAGRDGCTLVDRQ